MKRIIIAILISIMAMNLMACAKCINTETKEVEVTISDSYYHGSYVTFSRAGKVNVPITHPAVYRIMVTYNEGNYTISGSDTYKKYKDKIGEKAKATLVIRTYDNGKIINDITEIK